MNVIVDITKTVLETNRLILRAFELNDLDDLYDYAKVYGVGEMAGWSCHKNKEESLDILNMFIREKKTFAIVLKENNKVIGSIGLEICQEDLEGYNSLKGREIGYAMNKKYWGKGIMVEAVSKIIDHYFKNESYDFFTAQYFEYNVRSKRVLEKLNFKYLKDLKTKTRMNMTGKSILLILLKNDI